MQCKRPAGRRPRGPPRTRQAARSQPAHQAVTAAERTARSTSLGTYDLPANARHPESCRSLSMRELCVSEDDGGSSRDHPPVPISRWGHVTSASADVSIAQLIKKKMESKTFFMSVELIPGTTPLLQRLLDQSLQLMSSHAPAFVSVTWHVEHLNKITSGSVVQIEHPAIELSRQLQQIHGIPALMHLSAGKMDKGMVLLVLKACLASGVTNVLALRGDEKSENGADFQHASDLVRFIRQEFGSVFTIAVAGYPSGHPEAVTEEDDLLRLKEKVDVGADFVLTQMITSFEEFHNFTLRCLVLEMKVPIVPGLFLIQSFECLDKMIKICKIKIPPNIIDELKCQPDKMKEKEYGECLLQSILQSFLRNASCPGVHFFTMNR